MERLHEGRSDLSSLIMFDGPDGVGKSTQIRLAVKALSARKIKTYSTRLSGGTDIGERLREISLNPALKRSARTDLYIVLAMYNALSEELLEKRDSGYVCLVDRSPLSIIAYQVWGSGLSLNVGIAYVREALAMFGPDAIICYEAPSEVLKQHRLKRDGKAKLDFFESQPDEYNDRVIDGYKEAANQFGVSIVNADADKKTVHKRTMEIIDLIVKP